MTSTYFLTKKYFTLKVIPTVQFLIFGFLDFLIICLFVFPDRVSLCNSSGSPTTRFVGQAGLELKGPPASVSQVLVFFILKRKNC